MMETFETPFSLKDRTILVTGASSGIGRATAIQASRLGAKVILVARNRQRLDETLLELTDGSHSAFSIDLADQEQLHGLIDSLPTLDGAVLCARQRIDPAQSQSPRKPP